MQVSPWQDPAVAIAQRELNDCELAGEWPAHFRALAEAFRRIDCPGSVLEVGCGGGINLDVLTRAGMAPKRYRGVDISMPALGIANERHPDREWHYGEAFAGYTQPAFDVALDGTALMHVEDWRAHLAALCNSSRRWVILHRVPCDTALNATTHRTETEGYGKRFPAWRFAPIDLSDAAEASGFRVTPLNVGGYDGTWTVLLSRPRHFCSYFDAAYLPKARAMWASLQRHCPNVVLHALCWDDAAYSGAEEAGMVATHARDFLAQHSSLGRDYLPGPQRTDAEYMWTVGPHWVADVMERTRQPVTYVDADVFFFSSPEPVFGEISGASAGVVPHNFRKEPLPGLPVPSERTHLQFGRFNVGLVHFGDLSVAKDWAAECRDWCFDRASVPIPDRAGRYGDQKYLDAWPEKHGADVVEHPGACLGPWALWTRGLDQRNGVVHYGNRPLVSYHFSSFTDLDHPTRLEYCMTKRHVEILAVPYAKALKEAT